MICPTCGGATRVIDSRKAARQIRRRRECKECGKRFTTIEMHRGEAEALQQLKAWWLEIVGVIQVLESVRTHDYVEGHQDG
jgi:hypothetical protein